VPRRLACWSSSSLSCCSRSIWMMRGTTRTRKVVPAIHAALPVLFRSFFVTNAASHAACLPRNTMGDPLSLAITPLLVSPLFAPRLSGRDTPPLRGWDAIARETEGRWLSTRVLTLQRVRLFFFIIIFFFFFFFFQVKSLTIE